MNIAAIRWLTTGKDSAPAIQYMLLNEHLDYLISPKEMKVTHLKTNIKQIFDTITTFSNPNIPLQICYKSIVMGYWQPRRDSKKFHKLVNKALAKRHLTGHKTAFLLKKEELDFFKKALYFLDIDCKTPGHAYIAHLWTIALKVTKSRIDDAIIGIWKKRQGIKRMTEEHRIIFEEFYSLL